MLFRSPAVPNQDKAGHHGSEPASDVVLLAVTDGGQRHGGGRRGRPVYKLEELCELQHASDASIVKAIADFVLKRFDKKSPSLSRRWVVVCTVSNFACRFVSLLVGF